VLTASVVLAAVQSVTGLRLPLFHLMVDVPAGSSVSPLTDSLIIVGNIALVLTGAFTMVLWVSRVFRRPIEKLSRRLGMNEAGGAGLVATLANIFPALELVRSMNPKGKLLVLTFSISASCMLGDHLGFTAGVDQDMVLPMIVSKLVAAVTALLLANLLAPKLMDK